MKKLFLAVAAVAMVFATSCKKENTNAPEEPIADNEFVCVIDQNANPQNAPMVDDGMGTMAHIDGSNNVWWQENDVIRYIGQEVDNSGGSVGNPSAFDLLCSKMSDNRAYFSDGSKHFGQGTHEAYYPASLVTGGSYSSTKGKYEPALKLPSTIEIEDGKNAAHLPMYGTGSGTHYITFHNICAVLKITIPNVEGCTKIVLNANQNMCGTIAIEQANSIYNARPNTGNNYKTLTVEKSDDGTFAENEVVYVPIIPRNTGLTYLANGQKTYTGFTIVLKDANGETLNVPADPQEISVETNKVYPVELTPKTGGGKHTIVDDYFLSSKFNIGEDSEHAVWVQFTKGNLYYDGSSLQIEDDQLRGGQATNVFNTHICQFFFTGTADSSALHCPSYSNLPINLFCKTSGNYGGAADTYALTQAQWVNLNNNHVGRVFEVKRNSDDTQGQMCVLFAPDGYNDGFKQVGETYTLAQVDSLGFLCLPNTGLRNSSGYMSNWAGYISYLCADRYYDTDADNNSVLKMVMWNPENTGGNYEMEVSVNCNDDGNSIPYDRAGSIRLVRNYFAPQSIKGKNVLHF